MGTYIEPFGFRKIIMNYFIGNASLFIFVLIIIYSFVAAKYQMSNRVYLILLAFGAILFASYVGEAWYFFTIILVGFLSMKLFSKILT